MHYIKQNTLMNSLGTKTWLSIPNTGSQIVTVVLVVGTIVDVVSAAILVGEVVDGSKIDVVELTKR